MDPIDVYEVSVISPSSKNVDKKVVDNILNMYQCVAAQSLRLSKIITSAALDSVVHDLKFNVLNVYVSLILSVGFSLVECWENMGNGPFFWVATAGFGKYYTGGSCRIGLVINEGLTQGDVCMKEHVTISVSFPTFCQLLVYIISIFPHLYIYNIVLDVCVYVGVYVSVSVSLYKLFFKKHNEN